MVLYFRALFTFNNQTSTSQNNIVLHDVAGEVLGDLVEFFYTGSVALIETNVQNLATAADMLQVCLFKCNSQCLEIRL